MGFVTEEVALEQVFLKVPEFSLMTITPPLFVLIHLSPTLQKLKN
jgi:hypothetical protein